MIIADIIPKEFFDQHSLMLLLFVVVSIAFLVFGADRAVLAAVRLAKAQGFARVIVLSVNKLGPDKWEIKMQLFRSM